MIYKYLVPIFATPLIDKHNFENKFIEIVQSSWNPLHLEMDGQFYFNSNNKYPQGMYQFLDKEAYVFDLNLLKGYKTFLGELVGFFNWEWFNDKLEDKKFLLEHLQEHTNGLILDTHTNHFFSFIALQNFNLEHNLYSKNGFTYGVSFLRNLYFQEAYEKYVKKEIIQAIGQVLPFDKIKEIELIDYNYDNPIRIKDYKYQGELKGITVNLWTYDFDLFATKAFEDFLQD